MAVRPPRARALALHGNRILASLGPHDYQRLRAHLTVTPMEQGRKIWGPNEPITTVYFPTTSIVSVLAVTDVGPVEVGTIGNEGVVGLPIFLGANSFAGRAMVQIAGEAEEMPAEAFRRAALEPGPLRDVLQRYTLGFMTQVAQGTACNRAHSAEQRLARWLLVVRDRVGRNEFDLTHEFMGQMLGVRRATVSETAGALQERGLITYKRGVITILNGRGLEKAACECYRIVRDEFERLLGVSVG